MHPILAHPVGVLELWQWLGLVGVVLAGVLACRRLESLTLHVGIRAASLTRTGWDDRLLEAGRGPLRYLLLALVVAAGSRLLRLTDEVERWVDVLARSLAVVSVAWFALRSVDGVARAVEQSLEQDKGAEVGRTRGLRTQLAVLRRVAQAVLYLVSGALLLLQFEAVRNLGVSLLASAGLAGLVLGLAAQKSISTLLAGLQLSITQPVRMGDTVIVEGEWGWVEEITLTYVVVKVWDLRRLVVPMSHFLEKPFQNWSKVSPELLGTVELFVDHRAEVEGLRVELRRILEEEGRALWDGRAQGVQVTGCSERSVTVRALMSAANAGQLWDLRCLVRERLLQWLQRQPHGLPLLRTEVSPRPAGELWVETAGLSARTAPVGGRNEAVAQQARPR